MAILLLLEPETKEGELHLLYSVSVFMFCS